MTKATQEARLQEFLRWRRFRFAVERPKGRMPSTTRRLQTILQFAEQKDVTPGTKATLGRFLLKAPGGHPGGDTCGMWFGSHLPVPTDGELQDLQRRVRYLLHAAVGRVALTADMLTELEVNPPRMALSVGDHGEITLVAVDGTFSDRFLFAALMLLRESGVGCLRQCPVCGRVFPKQGKRIHCGRKACAVGARKIAWRKWRDSPKGRQWLDENVYKPGGWTLGARRETGEAQKDRGKK